MKEQLVVQFDPRGIQFDDEVVAREFWRKIFIQVNEKLRALQTFMDEQAGESLVTSGSLPAAGENYLGRWVHLRQPGAGQDQVWTCIQQAGGGAYVWHQVV